MKVLFLHLSDAHIANTESVRLISREKIVNSLKVLMPFEKCYIVFSGDLTHSSTTSEIEMVMSFLKKLSRDIKSKYQLEEWVDTFLVPGNHDLSYSKINRDGKNSEIIKTAFLDKERDNKIEEIFYNDLNGFIEFSRLQRYFKCYCQHDPIVNHKMINIERKVVDICMINTAPLSLRIKTNEDKLYHHLTQKNLKDIMPSDEADLRILIMHHPIEWFHGEVKEKLQKIVNKFYNIVFVGHEHSYRSEVKNINNESEIIYLYADALLENSRPIGYSVAKLDTNTMKFDEYRFKWNNERGFYEQGLKRDIDVYLKVNKGLNVKFPIKKEYLEILEKEPKENLKKNLSQYYIFPMLTYHPNNELDKEKNITCMDDLIDLLNAQKKIFIRGGNNSGKTSLCNMLCMKLAEKSVPVIIKGEFVARGAKIDKVIKQSFMDMYGDDASLYHEYEQLDKNKKVIMVDNINLWSNASKEKVISYLSLCYETIILFSDIELNLDVIEQVKNSLRNDKYYDLTIEPFYYDLREKLIEKTLLTLDCVVYKSDVERINEFIHSQAKYCPRVPEFIIQFVKYYRDCGGEFSDDRQNVFSIVFENEIYNNIKQVTENIDINEIFTALEEIAYNMHFKKMYPMKYTDMVNIIDNYNKKYDEEVKAKKIHDIAVRARIFKEIDEINTFIFKEKRVLAYFVARCLVKKKHELTTIDDLNFLLHNMCFSINGDIMLFLAYITREINILTCILKCAKESLKEWTEFSFDNNSGKLDYLKYISGKERITLPVPEDKDIEKKHKGVVEKEIAKADNNDVPEIYDYDENESESEFNKLLKSIKMLELISKMLPNFSGTFISAEIKKECVDLIYSYPNKIIFYLCSVINNNFIQNVEEIKKEVPELSENLGGDIETIAKELALQSVMFIANLYYYTARLCANKKTLRVLDKHDNSDLTYMLQNTLMHIKNGSFDEFFHRIMNIKKNSDNKAVEYIAALIVREYILCNDDIVFHGNGEKLIKAFFGDDIKKLQLETYKSRIIKKD